MTKHLFQVICQDKKDWDEPLEGEVLQKWSLIVNDPAEIQLHAFSDVSIKAYTAVVFMRSVYGDGQVQARFIASKSRVVPLKTQTIYLFIYWIKNERVWKQYVKHRVSEIRQK